MGMITVLMTFCSIMQLTAIWNCGTEGQSLGGWFCLLTGLGLLTERSKQQGDDPAFWSFFFQTTVVALIIVSIIYLDCV